MPAGLLRLRPSTECIANLEAVTFKDLRNITVKTVKTKHTNSKACTWRSDAGMWPPSCLCTLRAGNLEACVSWGPTEPLAPPSRAPATVTSIASSRHPPSSVSVGRGRLSCRAVCWGTRAGHLGSPWRVCHVCVGPSTDSLHPCGLLEDSMPLLECRVSPRGARAPCSPAGLPCPSCIGSQRHSLTMQAWP